MTEGGEAECVLLFNPETNKFELRPLDYSIRVAPASKDRKTSPSEEEEPVIVEPPPFTKPEDTMQHWEEKFRAQDNKGSNHRSYDGGSSERKPYKSKSKPFTQIPAAPVQTIKFTVPDNDDADIEMGHDLSDNNDDDDDDDELLGELVNELEGSLEDDGKPNATSRNDESDSDDDTKGGGMIEIVENRSKTNDTVKSFYQSPPKSLNNQQGPISLRGFISGQQRRENEEDLLSSSEEE